MNFGLTLIDTDVLSAVLKRHPAATARAEDYLSKYGRLAFSAITRYEIPRGLLATGSASRVAAFDAFCAVQDVLDIDDPVIIRASELHAVLRGTGVVVGDADILIAATALVHRRSVATHNTRHFEHVPELAVDDWLVQEV